jgi:hypothetical protein
MLAKPTNDLNDDLSDLLGVPSEGARPLPADEASARIRESTPAFQMIACNRCGGTGTTRWGQCFKCRGARTVKARVLKTSPEQRARKRAGRLDRKLRNENANWAAFVEAFPAEAKWIDGNPDFEFARDMRDKVHRYGDLHPNAMAAVQRLTARAAERTANAEARQQEAVARSVEIDTAKIEAAFQARRDAGKKRIALHYAGLFINPMKNSPGALRVKAAKGYDAVYYGKIEAGRFYPSRNCPDEIKARLAIIAADPAAAARVDGIETGICCCCGAELTDPVSIAAGIGPICATGWGF